MKDPTLDEIKAIVLAEQQYWNNAPHQIGIAAIGACCNIYAALCGLRAPWHPDPTKAQPEQPQRSIAPPPWNAEETRLINQALSDAGRGV